MVASPMDSLEKDTHSVSQPTPTDTTDMQLKEQHGHCPDGCEHPQPVMLDGELLCGRCLIYFGEKVRIEPCNC